MSIKLLFALPLLVLSAHFLFAQTGPEDNLPQLTIYSRTVVEDVVVVDKTGKAVPGLQKGDFQVFDDGKPQAITFFEPNFEATETPTPQSMPTSDTFTNIRLADPGRVTNILLLDALDSWPEDEMYAHVQMVKYLASLPPHLRIGIFTLTPEKLNLIWPLNEDSSALKSAISQFSSKHSAPSSTAAQHQALLAALSATQEAAQQAQDIRLVNSAYALQTFLKSGVGVIQQHNHGALEALQALAHYLAGIPGRKNLFWIVGNFPRCEPINACSGATIDMLAEAAVSVYPIDAHGVDVDMGIGPDPSSHQAAARFIDNEYWAEVTGGKAYHANDIDHEIADAVDHGSRYYMLAYVPSNYTEQGRERSVEVKVAGNYTIFYRRHYLEQTRKKITKADIAPVSSPLIPLMGHGLPNSDGIPYRLKVVSAAAQPQHGMKLAGQNTKLSGKLTRYNVVLQVQPGGLPLLPDSDGVRRKTLQVALVVYGEDFKPRNWEIRDVHLHITPEEWATAETAGIPFQLEIDAPTGDVSLRTGVYDRSSSKVGTLEIPLTALTLAQK